MTGPSETIDRTVALGHRFGPVRLHLAVDHVAGTASTGTRLRVDQPIPTAITPAERLDDGIAVHVDGALAAHLRQPTRGWRRHRRAVVVDTIPGSPLRPGMYFRLRFWKRVTLETSGRGLVAHRLFPLSPRRRSTADDVTDAEFLLHLVGSGVVRANLTSAAALGPARSDGADD